MVRISKFIIGTYLQGGLRQHLAGNIRSVGLWRHLAGSIRSRGVRDPLHLGRSYWEHRLKAEPWQHLGG